MKIHHKIQITYFIVALMVAVIAVSLYDLSRQMEAELNQAIHHVVHDTHHDAEATHYLQSSHSTLLTLLNQHHTTSPSTRALPHHQEHSHL